MGKRTNSSPNTSQEIKSRFGTLFRAARDRLKISRATLAHKLGVSPKTVQSWEMGRTFVEDLSLVPLIESELNISFQEIIEVALNNPNLWRQKNENLCHIGFYRKTFFATLATPGVERLEVPGFCADTLKVQTSA